MPWRKRRRDPYSVRLVFWALVIASAAGVFAIAAVDSARSAISGMADRFFRVDVAREAAKAGLTQDPDKLKKTIR